MVSDLPPPHQVLYLFIFLFTSLSIYQFSPFYLSVYLSNSDYIQIYILLMQSFWKVFSKHYSNISKLLRKTFSIRLFLSSISTEFKDCLFPELKNHPNLLLISGRISGLFCYPVSGRISGYRYRISGRISGRPDTGYPADYHEKNYWILVGGGKYIFFRLSLLQLEYCKMLICLRILLYIGSGN